MRTSLQALWSALGYPDVSLASRNMWSCQGQNNISKESWSKVRGALKGICAMEPGLPKWGKVYSLGERWSGKASRKKWNTRLCTFIWLSKLEVPLTITPKKDKSWPAGCETGSVWFAEFEVGMSNRHLEIMTWVLGRGRSLRDRFGNFPWDGQSLRGAQEGSSLIREHEEWKGG